MAPRRVIADSDDEDSGDEPLSPLGREIDPPQPEPLSSPHRPSSPDPPNSHIVPISDTTDPSFFAEVYNEQQSRALRQSHLIENIVRQSQKASASSGHASSPANARGRKSNPSSVADVSFPVVLDGLGKQKSTFDNDTSEITTPRKSTGDDEWDVPSSPGDIPSRSAGSLKGEEKNTYEKQRRSRSGSAEGPVGAQALAPGDLASKQTAESPALESSPFPATKKGTASLHDLVIPENTKIYVAQSNLTTMQKLEYQRVSISQNGYAGLPGTLSNQKSSCATTVAYPTPSRYTSSGPPLPWERPATATQEESSHEVPEITSSPDVIALEHSSPPRDVSDALQGEDTIDSPHKSPSKVPPVSRNKKRTIASEEADELGQDEPYDSDANDDYRENYKPRPSRRRTRPSTVTEEDAFEEDPIPTTNDCRPENIVDTDVEVIPDAPTNPLVDEAPKYDQPESIPAPQPKKRGRKKKQPVTETSKGNSNDDVPVIIQEPSQPEIARQSAILTEKPKKKRGRPRKSDSAKVEAAVPEQNVAPKTLADLESNEAAAQPDNPALDLSDEDTKERKTKKLKVGPKENTNINDGAASDTSLPLKDVDRNTRSPSKTSSSGEPPTKVAEGSSREKPASKSEAKKTSSSTPQSKVPYRIGLSKRSRIAPLLKVIRK